MKTVVSVLFGLLMLVGVVMPARAADCTVKGWVDSGQQGRPIFDCPDQS
jgi:hypothetical protein